MFESLSLRKLEGVYALKGLWGSSYKNVEDEDTQKGKMIRDDPFYMDVKVIHMVINGLFLGSPTVTKDSSHFWHVWKTKANLAS